MVTNFINQSIKHIVSKGSEDINEITPFTFMAGGKYTSSIFQGIMIDTGASLFSTADHRQVQARSNYLKIDIETSTAGKVNVQFGIGATFSIGSINVDTQIELINFHVVHADTPFILCLFQQC